MTPAPETTAPGPSALERPLWRTTGWILVFLLPLFGRIWLIGEAPALYSWDAFTRLWDPSTFAIRHWLPVPQTPVFLLAGLGFEVPEIRLVYAIVGSGAATVLGLVVARSFGTVVGLATALLASCLPIFVKFSIVPYQEGFALLFLSTALLALDDWERREMRSSAVVAAASLACGLLCRYEVWGFCGLLAAGFVARGKWRRCVVLVPAVVAGLAWIATSGLRDTLSPNTGRIPGYELADLLARGLESSLGTARQLAGDIFCFNAVPAVLGAIVAFRRGGLLGRELLVFWLGLMGMVIIRDINSDGLTDRMTLLPSLVSVVYVVIGAEFLVGAVLRKRRAPALAILCVALAAGFFHDGYRSAVGISGWFGPEREAARLLLGVVESDPGGGKVVVVPRRMPNRFDEDPIKSIFSNSTRLNPFDGRWIWGERRLAETDRDAALVLLWNPRSGKYLLVPARDLP